MGNDLIRNPARIAPHAGRVKRNTAVKAAWLRRCRRNDWPGAMPGSIAWFEVW
jgi:hypothetical protein